MKIMSYRTVDTIVGRRFFFDVPRATQQIDSGPLTAAGGNKVPSAILLNRQTNLDQADETAGIPSAVLSAIQTTFTAAISDVRPEDAKFEVNRILATFSASGTGLGYGNPANATCFQAPDSWTVSNILGCPIYGTWGGRSVPVQYSLTGTDPFTGSAAWKRKTIEVRAAPLIFWFTPRNTTRLDLLAQTANTPST